LCSPIVTNDGLVVGGRKDIGSFLVIVLFESLFHFMLEDNDSIEGHFFTPSFTNDNECEALPLANCVFSN
jgi:hypothetical protein